MKSKDAIESLAALAQESRLTIFRMLVKRGPEGYTPTQLGEKLKVSSPTLSFHLKELQRGGTDRRAPGWPVSVLPAEFHPHESADRVSHRKLLCPRRQRVPPGLQSSVTEGPAHQEETRMKRFHIHVSVENLDRSIEFYSTPIWCHANPRRGRLRQMDAGGSAHELRDLDAAPAGWRQSPRASRWTPMMNCGACTRSWQAADSQLDRGDRTGVLLREVGQVLGDGSNGHRLGDLPYPRQHPCVRRRTPPYSTTVNPSFRAERADEKSSVAFRRRRQSQRPAVRYVLWPLIPRAFGRAAQRTCRRARPIRGRGAADGRPDECARTAPVGTRGRR